MYCCEIASSSHFIYGQSGKRGSGRAEPDREIEGSDFEEDRDSQEVDKDSFEINDESLVIPATFKDELDKQYRAMKNQHKLLLPSSKRYAEDIMYQYSKAADAETAFKSLCGHWILDLDWAAKSKAARDTELEDLSKIAVDALPDLPEGYDYIFDCFDTEDIKESEIALVWLSIWANILDWAKPIMGNYKRTTTETHTPSH